MNAGEIKPETVAQAFGKVLRSYRVRSGLSQERLAESIEMDRTYVSMLERGIHQPSLTVVLRLALVLDTSPADLIDAAWKETRLDNGIGK